MYLRFLSLPITVRSQHVALVSCNSESGPTNQTCVRMKHYRPPWVAQPDARAVFDCSNTGSVGLNTARTLMYIRLYSWQPHRHL
jgi:hypothetical protein